MRDLVEFLRARLDEDEAVARRLEPDPVWMRVGSELAVDNEDEIAISAGRVLREVEAKRRILGEHSPDVPDPWGECATCAEEEQVEDHGDHVVGYRSGKTYPCLTVRLLTLPYCDHPDYQEEWAG